MLESWDHQQILDSSEVLDLTFAFRLCGRLGCDYQIHSTSAAFLFEVAGSNSSLVVQELQIGGASVAPEASEGLYRWNSRHR
jgi:hypothetical protein